MAAEKSKMTADQKRKILLVLRILLITGAVLYILFLLYNNFLAEDKYQIYFATSNANYLQAESRTLPEEADIYFQLFEELKPARKPMI